MSYYNPVVPAGPRPRPGVVTMSGYLLYAVAALLTVNVLISLATLSKALDAVRAAVGNTDADFSNAFKVGEVIGAVIDLGIVVLFVLLGLFVLRGKNGMRITTWVVAGLGTLCSLCSVAGSGISQSMANSKNSSLSDSQISAIKDAVPGWARATSIVVYLLIAIALIAVIIMLAMPAANEFFRKPNLMAMPGYGAPGYGAPGYGAPAYPTYGQPPYPAGPPQPPYPTGQQPPPYPAAPDPSQPWASPTQPPVNPQDPTQGPTSAG